MGCIKAYWLGSVFAVAVVAGGCASLPEEQHEPVDEDAWVLIPNPYLQQRVDVPEQVQKPFEEAVAAMQSEDWEVAQELLQTIVESHPELSGPYVNLGIVYWQLNDMEASSQAFDQAINANPLNHDAYNQYAILQREQGRFEAAEALYLTALEVWPHNMVAHRNLGILYDLYFGEFEKAMQHYEMANKIAKEPSRELQGWVLDLQRRLDAS